MSPYNSLKDEVLKSIDNTLALLDQVKQIPNLTSPHFIEWENTCRMIEQQMIKDLVRVAVVGAIKSGKSTFVNSLLKGDFLKRGAGVVTSIVTRIRHGRALKAVLYFKCWDEVNADIEHALVLFPNLNWKSEYGNFDIRRATDRGRLADALKSLSSDQLITDGSRNVDSVLLSSYLQGFEQVKDIIAAETTVQEYNQNGFAEHKRFVGDDALAVYLKDVKLEIAGAAVDSQTEIADCQGSDSPNPLHLAMIQDYLLLTHFIVYVISSRTGLREADIKFLSMIKKMGIMDNILFVVNCDLSEHDSLQDLTQLIAKIKSELALIKPEPQVYPLSSLYNLFCAQDQPLPPKDSMRLAQWRQEDDLIALSEKNTALLMSDLTGKLNKQRLSLMVQNHIQRLSMVQQGMAHWSKVNRDILTCDRGKVTEMVTKISTDQVRIDQIRTMIKSTLDGAVRKIKQDMRSRVDRFFDQRSGAVFKEIIEFVKSYQAALYNHEENLKVEGFSNALYQLFQEFKQALDTFMAERINPEIVRFFRDEEKKVNEYFESVAGPYELMVHEALNGYHQTLKGFGVASPLKQQKGVSLPKPDTIKAHSRITMPAPTAALRYSARIRTDAVVRFGFYSIVNAFKKILKKPVQSDVDGQLKALKDGMARIKRETHQSIIAHFKDLRENMKFQYIFKYVDAVAGHLLQALNDRFQVYTADLSHIVELIDNNRLDKDQAVAALTAIEADLKQQQAQIESIKAKTIMAVA